MKPKVVPFKEKELENIISPNIRSTFVFLETAYFDSGNIKSFLFPNLSDFLIFHPDDDLDLFTRNLEKYLKRGFWLAGFFSYEFGYFLEPSLYHLRPRQSKFPIAWLGICKNPLIFYHNMREEDERGKNNLKRFQYNLSNLSPNLNETEYRLCIGKIKNYIEKGLTYQVNFTYKYKFDFQGDILGFYLNLRRAQPTSYMAFFNTGREYILSFSPELFFRLEKEKIKVKPMKGTCTRGYLSKEDDEKRDWLRNDIKNCAENIMIVDLLRNDLGRISHTGSVKVEELFEIEKYRTLHQMTSTIKSSLRKNTLFKDIFVALFPSGSVTGAPKISTMKIIYELEKEPRNVYTGAIGYISPNREACFNVAIRTILIKDGQGQMGVGGGIVYDSLEDLEYKETCLKAKFLTQKFPKFSLIETIRWENNKGYWLLDLHLKRLADSAEYFQVPLDLETLKCKLLDLEKIFEKNKGIYKVRILVNLEAEIKITYRLLDEIVSPVKVKLSPKKVEPDNLFLYHKTTQRYFYNNEKAQANKQGFFEVVFTNTRGELTEGTISNVFLLIQNKLFTPPVKCGLLPGVLRQHLLEKGQVQERVLYPDDILKADKFFIGNSVRGLLEANSCLR